VLDPDENRCDRRRIAFHSPFLHDGLPAALGEKSSRITLQVFLLPANPLLESRHALLCLARGGQHNCKSAFRKSDVSLRKFFGFNRLGSKHRYCRWSGKAMWPHPSEMRTLSSGWAACSVPACRLSGGGGALYIDRRTQPSLRQSFRYWRRA